MSTARTMKASPPGSAGPRDRRQVRGLVSALALLALAGCARYHDRPLAQAADLRAALPPLVTPAKTPPLPAITPAPFDPARGLTATQTAELAVLADPALKALRAQVGVAHAQMFAAGLLPDPELTLAGARVLSAGPGLYSPWSVALTEDLARLLTRGDRQDAAHAHLAEVNLSVLWQEWQVAARAQELWIEIRSDQRAQHLLAGRITLYRQAVRAYRAANASGALTQVALAHWQAAALQTRAELGRAARRQAGAASDLRLLLGLTGSAPLPLRGPIRQPESSAARIAAAVQALPHRRPDLLALAAGYRSANARLRLQILAQFPGVSVQLNRARDNNGVQSAGAALGIQLPLFNGNRGRIAEARASRRFLRAQYQARLDQAVASVGRLQALLASLRTEQRAVARPLPRLHRMAQNAHRAFDQGALDFAAYADAQQYYFQRATLALRLERSLAQGQVALQTLLGLPRPGGHSHS